MAKLLDRIASLNRQTSDKIALKSLLLSELKIAASGEDGR